MRTLRQCLQDYPQPLLAGIAESRHIALRHEGQPEAVEQLAAALVDALSVASAVASCSAAARTALRELSARGGRLLAPAFERNYGTIRHFGPRRLAEESPWREVCSAAEELWYRALIARGFGPTEEGVAEFVFVPSDVLPHLPVEPRGGPSAELVPTADPKRTDSANDDLLEDACTLLSFLDQERAAVDQRGRWRTQSLRRLNERLLRPVAVQDFDLSASGEPLALLLHLANDLGWAELRKGRLQLAVGPAKRWLQRSRAEQRNALWGAWRDSVLWDDVCRVPKLRCEGTWQHDPLLARQRVLTHLAKCEVSTWYDLADFTAFVKQIDPDFQRPSGRYDTWYIKHLPTGRYLTGFGDWEHVEGALIAYILAGPSHWLGGVDLGISASSGDVSSLEASSALASSDTDGTANNTMFRISSAGGALLGSSAWDPPDPSAPTIRILPDFTVRVPPGFPCLDRFRLARFTTWQASSPSFQYRITQRALRRAQAAGIDARRVLDFLHRVADGVPPNVARALQKWEE